MKTNKIINSVKVLMLALVLAAGVSYISAWTGPTVAAPGGNVDAPLNVGLNTQSKLGALFLNTSNNPLPIGLEVFGQSIFNGTVQINSGSPANGKVLTATDASGTVSWITPSTSSSGGSFNFIPPVDVSGTQYGEIGYTTYDAHDDIPVGATHVILQATADKNNGNADVDIVIRKNASAPSYELLRGRASGGGDSAGWGNQGIFPVDTNRTFQWAIIAGCPGCNNSGFNNGANVSIIGYIGPAFTSHTLTVVGGTNVSSYNIKNSSIVSPSGPISCTMTYTTGGNRGINGDMVPTGTCTNSYSIGASITLTATPTSGTFANATPSNFWSGCDSQTTTTSAATCTVTISDTNRNVTFK